jgi:hypothetical protein
MRIALAVALMLVVASAKDNSRKVSEVTSVTAKRSGKNIIVTAKGNVPTGGWTKPRLVRINAHTLELRAVPPDGMATQMITKISATTTIKSSAREVRVVAQRNAMTARVGAPSGATR